jgi:hypothetical protein
MLCKPQSCLLLWYVLEKTAVTLPSFWNFAILPLPSLEFCGCRRWNFAFAVIGILQLPPLEFCGCRCWKFAVGVMEFFHRRHGISPSPLELWNSTVAVVMEFCCCRHWNMSCGPCRSGPEVSFLGAASLTCLLHQSSFW